MRFTYLRLVAASAIIAFDFFVSAVHAEPAANLPLTCSDAAAIGQPQNNCNGLLTYQLPISDRMIVLKGPSSAPVWSRASDIASTETLAVCSLPVEPGTYSSCRDASGMRRIVFVAKSQVFPGPTPVPPPGSSGARILDLSRVPVEIIEPGVYVLDRNWSELGLTFDGTIIISADDVTLDFQGFELSGENARIVSTGQRARIRNGRIVAYHSTIDVSGADTLIEHMRAHVKAGNAIRLSGRGTVLTDSDASADNDGGAVYAGEDTIVRENRLEGPIHAVHVSSRTTVADNLLACGRAFPCITVDGANNFISGNRFTVSGADLRGILIRGDHNQVLDNVFRSNGGRTAIVVEGQWNIIRDNLVIHASVPGLPGVIAWEIGIAFLRDGNFYGDNLVSAATPFDVGATVQTDLGGNSGFSP